MNVFEKTKATLLEDSISPDEQYWGIAFLYYSEIITQNEYATLMGIFNQNHPEYS